MNQRDQLILNFIINSSNASLQILDLWQGRQFCFFRLYTIFCIFYRHLSSWVQPRQIKGWPSRTLNPSFKTLLRKHNRSQMKMDIQGMDKVGSFQFLNSKWQKENSHTLLPGSPGREPWLPPKLLLEEDPMLLVNIISDPSDLLSMSSYSAFAASWLAFVSSKCFSSLQNEYTNKWK